MSVGPGYILLGLAIVAGLSGAFALRTDTPDFDRTIWVISETHAQALKESAQSWKACTGQTVHIETISAPALQMRLMSLFLAGRQSASIPDLVELETGSAGAFFRMPAGRSPFVSLDAYLNEYLGRRPSTDRLGLTRLSLWRSGGHLRGVPLDCHPVTLTYRADRARSLGIAHPLNSWNDLAIAYQNGMKLELPTSSANVLMMMLLQQGVQLIDANDRSNLTDRRIAPTIAFYARLAAGSGRIGVDASRAPGAWVRDLVEERIDAALTPDYLIDELKALAPELKGKLAMTALPRFSAEDRPTSTWGGTMVGIPESSRDPKQAWDLLEWLYLSSSALAHRASTSNVVPALMHFEPTTDSTDDPFFVDTQSQLLEDLARQIPERRVSPFDAVAIAKLNGVLGQAIDAVGSGDDATLESDCSDWLKSASTSLQDWIDFGRFRE